MSFTPHTQGDISAMLKAIGVSEIEQLFDEIPQHLLAKGFDSSIIPDAMTEMQAARFFGDVAKQDQAGLCFIGAGAYEHYIPHAVWELTGRGEFMTAYTPYQAEASQGTLQLIYEYQTMMASLMGLDVSNASMYDGASALAEAVLMAVRANRHSKSKKILVPRTLHPFYRQTVEALVKRQNIQLIELPYDPATGTTSISALASYAGQDIAALVIPQPNFFGALENVDSLTDWAHQHKALAIAVVNPTAMALLKEPGAWGEKGVDIACGEGQPLGVPMASGGPYFGFLTCREEFVRQMPGRIVGQTVDQDGKRGFTLTLQAREQHIRRSKATSNICTNQGLLMTAATIYLSLLGYEGLKRVAQLSHNQAHVLRQGLTDKTGLTSAFQANHFHEFVLRLPEGYCANELLHGLAQKGIQGGLALKPYYPELGEAILVCVTETKSQDDLTRYQDALKEILKSSTCKNNRVESCES